MKLSENTNVAMPIKNMIGIIIGVAMGIFAYTEITARLTSLETSRELMNADLLKASEQTTVDKEQFLLLEDLYETVEKHQELLDKNGDAAVPLAVLGSDAQVKRHLMGRPLRGWLDMPERKQVWLLEADGAANQWPSEKRRVGCWCDRFGRSVNLRARWPAPQRSRQDSA